MALLAATLLAGCGILGCDERREVIEIQYGSITEDLDRLALQWARADGLECSSDGALRNAFGNVIGERWICRGC